MIGAQWFSVVLAIVTWLAGAVWLIRENHWTPTGLRERKARALADRIALLERDTDRLRLEAARDDTERREQRLEALAYQREYARYLAARGHRPDAGDEITMKAAAQYAAQRILTDGSVVTGSAERWFSSH